MCPLLGNLTELVWKANTGRCIPQRILLRKMQSGRILPYLHKKVGHGSGVVRIFQKEDLKFFQNDVMHVAMQPESCKEWRQKLFLKHDIQTFGIVQKL